MKTFRLSCRLLLSISSSNSRFIHLSSRKIQRASNDEYQFIQRSSIPTHHFQDSLPRYPIPDLDKTCDRYLQSLKVILDPQEYTETERIVQQFRGGVGKELNAILHSIDEQNRDTSYISSHWLDLYLSDRTPLPLGSIPAVGFASEPRKEARDPVVRASNFIFSSLRFKNALEQEVLEPLVIYQNGSKSRSELFKNVDASTPSTLASHIAYGCGVVPLDTSQYKYLFNSTRIPQKERDFNQKSENSKHVLIMKNGNFYVFDVYDKDGNIHPPSLIHSCVKYIYEDPSSRPEYPVSILTSENRDVWAKLRSDLIRAGNEQVLQLIDGAIFNLTFDDEKIGSDRGKGCLCFLCGDGDNRWYDKPFSIIITADGEAGTFFEHSWTDGVSIMKYYEDVLQETFDNPRVHIDSIPSNVDPSTLVRKLEFKIPENVKEKIKRAQSNYKERLNVFRSKSLSSDTVEKRFCKKNNISPDSVMQLAFLLAFYLQNGFIPCTYESCSTAAFKHGRTEALRPATEEVASFCQAVATSGKSNSSSLNLKKLMMDCSSEHTRLAKEAAMGQGYDRHLFVLGKLAQERYGKNLPEFFTHPSYAKSNHSTLCSSTSSTNFVTYGAFAPVTSDGLGISYGIRDEYYRLSVSWNGNIPNGNEYVECLERSFELIRSVLIK